MTSINYLLNCPNKSFDKLFTIRQAALSKNIKGVRTMLVSVRVIGVAPLHTGGHAIKLAAVLPRILHETLSFENILNGGFSPSDVEVKFTRAKMQFKSPPLFITVTLPDCNVAASIIELRMKWARSLLRGYAEQFGGVIPDPVFTSFPRSMITFRIAGRYIEYSLAY